MSLTSNKKPYDFKVENVVATINLGIEDGIDLMHVSRKFSDVEYNPERFPGLIMRFNDPKATLLLFSTGKVVCTGMRDAKNLEKIMILLEQNLKLCNIDVTSMDHQVQNIVASGNVKARIDLNMAAVIMEYSMYEPEVFPGLIYRMQEPKSVFLLFSTGKVVCTGTKNKEDAEAAVEKLYYEVREVGIVMETPELEEEEMDFI